MNIRLNGEKINIGKRLNIFGILKEKGIDLDKVIVEYNKNVLKRENWDKIEIKENDEVEILSFVGGG